MASSPLTLRYLGHYKRMFDSPNEEPMPTWSAISWMLEDYGLSKIEDMPADLNYMKILRQWPLEPPHAMANYPNSCPCPRRYKWNPHATLTSSVEYNWPLIAGPKSTVDECQLACQRFFEVYIHHLDLVCFRATVSCNTLANWCKEWNVVLDFNQFAECHHEFLFLLKLQYKPTRWGSNGGSHGHHSFHGRSSHMLNQWISQYTSWTFRQFSKSAFE